jgi:hypothetical protein
MGSENLDSIDRNVFQDFDFIAVDEESNSLFIPQPPSQVTDLGCELENANVTIADPLQIRPVTPQLETQPSVWISSTQVQVNSETLQNAIFVSNATTRLIITLIKFG